MTASNLFFGLVFVLGLLPLSALADLAKHSGRQNRGSPLVPSQLNAKWLQECGSCHLAFPPGLLPAESWEKIMSNLDRHFGTDLSLTADENKEITDFLTDNPSNRWNAPTYPLRITESFWFKINHTGRKNDIPAEVWKRPSISSPVNCQACHLDAATAEFDRIRVVVPN